MASSISLQIMVASIILLTILVRAVAIPTKELRAMFAQWVKEHNKTYKSLQEREERKKVFEFNVKALEKLNYTNSFKSPFLDRAQEDYNQDFGCSYYDDYDGLYNIAQVNYRLTQVDSDDIPQNVDWRKKGVLSPIQDQGRCGSCWAFASVAASEAIYKIIEGKLVDGSEQQVLDCNFGISNCTRGNYFDAFIYMAYNGIQTEVKYPYNGVKGQCDRSLIYNPDIQINNFGRIPKGDEIALMVAVASQPVAVVINPGKFLSYYSGSYIFRGPCDYNKKIGRHGMLVVGYGSDEGGDYWILRNSWGTIWGDEGYMKLEHGKSKTGGTCDVASNAVYPIIDEDFL